MILLIESSAQFPSVGLCDHDGNLIVHQERQETYSHAESLAEMVQSILSVYSGDRLQQDTQIKDDINAQGAQHGISAIAISSGPGSYTGLRIGTSLAKGLAMGYQVPLISVSALEGMADSLLANFPHVEYAFSMLDARRNEVYLFVKNHSGEVVLGPIPKILEPDEWSHFLQEIGVITTGAGSVWGCVSDCDDKVAEILHLTEPLIHVQEPPHVRHLAKIAAKKFEKQQFEDVAYFEPLYLKEFVAGVGKKFQL